MKRIAGIFVLTALVTVFSGCQDSLPVRNAVISYFDAIQTQNSKLFDSLIVCPDKNLPSSSILDFYIEKYNKERLEGNLDFDKYGIALAKILGIGRGTYYEFENITIKDGYGEVTIIVTTGYQKIKIDDMPQGTVFFFMGTPFGKVEQFEFKWGETLNRSLLSSIKINITLKEDVSSPTGFKVTAVEADSQSAKYVNVYREFEYPF